MRFEWDGAKAADNVARHGVSIPIIPSTKNGLWSSAFRHVAAFSSWLIRSADTIRIISARAATPGERKIYEEG